MQVPLSMTRVASFLAQAGVPPGVFQVLVTIVVSFNDNSASYI